LNGARAYVEQRQALQGMEDPPGSGRYPEPTWLGMIQHDMMLFDHGMPRADGTLAAEQRPEADVNIEFQACAKVAARAQQLAWTFQAANSALDWNSMFTSASGRCSAASDPSARGMPWSNSNMSCWIIPSHV